LVEFSLHCTMVLKAGVKRSASASGSSCVFVRGFDFGTTDEQFDAHMSQVGTIEKVKWITKGSAEVTYSSADEAAAAIEQLQKTTIDGNSRFIDVLARDGQERPTKRFNSGGKSWGKGGGGDQWALMQMIQSAFGGGGKSWGRGGGGGKPDDDPVGSGRVFVRGFDFGTDDELFKAHMSAAGPIHKIYWATKGSAVVVYKKKAAATKAASELNQTTIEGNSRYIDVLLKESRR